MSNSEGINPSDDGKPPKREKYQGPIRWIVWLGRLVHRYWCSCGLHQPHAPHWFIAVATFGLLGLAFMAWQESKSTTQALREQLDVLKAQQRPYMYMSGGSLPGILGIPQFNPANGQIFWTFGFANYGHSVAYNVVPDIRIKIGSEPFQPSGVAAPKVPILTSSVHYADLPPNAVLWGTAFSHEGYNSDYFDRIMKQEGGIQIRVEFHYTDASMKEQYTNGSCQIHNANGSIGVASAEQCQN